MSPNASRTNFASQWPNMPFLLREESLAEGNLEANESQLQLEQIFRGWGYLSRAETLLSQALAIRIQRVEFDHKLTEIVTLERVLYSACIRHCM